MIEPDDETLHADGFEDGFLGYAHHFSRILAVYERSQCIRILMKRDGMTEEEAEEFFSFNVIGSWVGEHTPIFLEYPICDACKRAHPPSFGGMPNCYPGANQPAKTEDKRKEQNGD